MHRKVIHTACWLALTLALAASEKTVKSSVVKNNVSAESAPRLYRNVGVYASAAPYAAFSFQVPAFVTSPNTAASRLIPVREQLIAQSTNGFLRDSYGNKFVSSPQVAAYKTAFPQQFVPLQDLPPHLAQPLLAAVPQTKQASPHYIVGSHYRLPAFPAHSYGSYAGSSQPFVHHENIRNLSPVSILHPHIQGIAVAQQQPSSNKAIYSDALSVEQFKNLKDSPKFQRLEYRPGGTYKIAPSSAPSHQTHGDNGQIQAAAAKTAITAVVNGQKTVINLDTKPPVPLLDLNLLEPLTFANPLVPQVQHYLPRINDATYHTLTELNENQGKAPNKEFVDQKKTNYHSGPAKGKPRKEIPKIKPKQPTITVKGTPDDFVYEINEPNHRETYKEKSISYNKESESEPVHYAYDKKTKSEPVHYSFQKVEQKEPVTYNFVHSSKQAPIEITQGPRQLIYTFHNGGPNKEHATSVESGKPDETESAEDTSSSEDTGSSEESQGEAPHHQHNHNPNSERYHKSSKNVHAIKTDRPEHRGNVYHHKPNPQNYQRSNSEHHPRQNNNNHDGDKGEHATNNGHHTNHHRENNHHVPNEGHQHRPKQEHHHRQHQESREYHPRQHQESKEYHPRQHQESKEYHPRQHQESKEYHPRQHQESREYHPRPKEIHHHSAVENRAKPEQVYVLKATPQYNEHIPQEYEEEIRLYSPKAVAAIKVDPAQHVHPSSPEAVDGRQQAYEHKSLEPAGPAPVIHEQAKRIIIQEESPDEMHVHQEQIMAEVIDEEDNNEEDFENAYKNAAFGFEAFEKKAADIEKDIYDPASYGTPPKSYNFDATPFQQYHAEGDGFPKSSRLGYKDHRDNMKEDYYLDYSANKPESLSDRYKNKANYYKLYKEHRPEKYFGEEQDKKKARYISSPSYDFEAVPKHNANVYLAQYKSEPIKYKYEFPKEPVRDNSAHASRPLQHLKIKSHFVEPQFQYGFEPVALPRLLDSELAAMASNDSPESEKPGMRKKIYEENWYIKKTSTSGGKPS